MDLAPGMTQTRQWIAHAYLDREGEVEDRIALVAIDDKGFCNKYPRVVRVLVFRPSMAPFLLSQSVAFLLASENRTYTKNNATSMMHPNSQRHQALKIALIEQMLCSPRKNDSPGSGQRAEDVKWEESNTPCTGTGL